jgi:undecaprenyl pyrophosphate phosphatase UppP
MSIFQLIILSIIEGITEFLPISSTGHMVIASSIMGIDKDTIGRYTGGGGVIYQTFFPLAQLLL